MRRTNCMRNGGSHRHLQPRRRRWSTVRTHCRTGTPGQDRLDEIRRLLRPPPPAAAGADRAALARQRHEVFEHAGVAPHAEEAMREDATAEEGANSRSMK